MAIDSILAQSHSAHEIIVVDDGSPEDCVGALARHSSVRLVRQNNCGVASARNRGARIASGDYLVFLDADDKLRPNAFVCGTKALAAYPKAGLVHGLCAGIDEHGHSIGVPVSPYIGADQYLQLLSNCHIWSTSTVMIRREVFWERGGFDERLRNCEDYDLYLKMAKLDLIVGYPEVVSDYRRHPGGKSHQSLNMLCAAVRILRRQYPKLKHDLAFRRALETGLERVRRSYGNQALRQWLASAGSTPKYRRWSDLTRLLLNYPGAPRQLLNSAGGLFRYPRFGAASTGKLGE